MSIYDVSAALDDLLHTVTLTRTAAGAHVKGEYIAGSAVDTSIQAHEQSMGPTEAAQFKSEGNQRKTIMRVFTKVKLVTSNDDPAVVADFITIDGVKYKVISVDPWSRSGKYYSSVIEG